MSDQHAALGRLRGRAAPAEHILDRITRLCATYRVHWSPWHDGKAYWIIANHIGSEPLRATGRFTMDRLRQESVLAAEPVPAAAWAGAELLMDGGWIVGRYTDEEFGGDPMFEDLRSFEARLTAAEAADYRKVKLRQLLAEWRLCKDEASRNQKLEDYINAAKREHPDWFREQDALIRDCWGYYVRGAKSVVNLGVTQPPAPGGLITGAMA